MKKEHRSLIYSMVNNLIISVMKVFGGLFFNMSSLLADGVHTFADFITDIFALIGAKMSKKRPTKIHPFGFGKIEYVTNLIIGFVIILLGIFILVISFTKEPVIPPIGIIWLLLVAALMKIFMINVLRKNGEKFNSGILITAAKESTTDLYSSVGVIIIVLVMQFASVLPILEYADLIGSILISILVIKTGIPIIKQNIMNLIGEVDIDEDNLSVVKDVLASYSQVKDSQIELIKYGTYYKAHLILELDPNITLRQISRLEKKIILELKKNKKIKIRYINFDVVPRLK